MPFEKFEVDTNHQEVYCNLKTLIKTRIGEDICFSFRKNGDGEHIFFVRSCYMPMLNLSHQKLISEKPWDIYVIIAQGLVK